MLPDYYQLKVFADCGQTLTGCYIDWNPWKLNGGAKSSAGVSNPVSNQSITDQSSYTSGTQANSSNYLGANANLRFSIGSSPTGNKQVRVYRLDSQDNTNFDSTSQAPIFTANVTASGAQDYGFEVPA